MDDEDRLARRSGAKKESCLEPSNGGSGVLSRADEMNVDKRAAVINEWENEVKCNVINTSICLADQKAARLLLGNPAILRDEDRKARGGLCCCIGELRHL